MVDQLSQPAVEDEAAAKVMPQPPTAAPPVEPGLLYIDGAWREASDGATAPTITPIDASEITTVAQATESDVDAAIAAARTAFDEGPWPGLNIHTRPQVLRRIAELIEQNLDELAYLESIDMGKPIAIARAIDAPMTAQIFHYYSGMATQLEGSTRGGSSPTTHPFPVAGLNYTEREPYVHVEDLAELFCLAAEFAPHRAILHGAADDVTQRDFARAINRMIGTDERTDSLSLLQMLGIDADTVGNIDGSFTPPATAASGISLSLNKRLSSDKTRKLLDWSPKRADIQDDIAFGSYVN